MGGEGGRGRGGGPSKEGRMSCRCASSLVHLQSPIAALAFCRSTQNAGTASKNKSGPEGPLWLIRLKAHFVSVPHETAPCLLIQLTAARSVFNPHQVENRKPIHPGPNPSNPQPPLMFQHRWEFLPPYHLTRDEWRQFDVTQVDCELLRGGCS